MNRAAVANLIALGEGLTTESCARWTSGLGREMCACASMVGSMILFRATDDDGEVVEMAETAGSSRFG